MSMEKKYLKAKWDEADEDRSGVLNRREVIRVVGTMNIDRPRAKLVALFDEGKVESYCDCRKKSD